MGDHASPWEWPPVQTVRSSPMTHTRLHRGSSSHLQVPGERLSQGCLSPPPPPRLSPIKFKSTFLFFKEIKSFV